MSQGRSQDTARIRRLRLRLSLALAGALGTVLAAPARPYLDRPLVEVLREFGEQGLEVIFSSAVVGPDLRVTVEPTAVEPRAILDEILAPLGLRAEDGPAGAILILPSPRGTGTLVGRVLQAADGTPIAAAVVSVPRAGATIATGADGSFAIPLPPGRHDVNVKALGFRSATISRVRVTPRGGDRPLEVRLQPQPAFVTEVVVTPGRHSLVRQEQASSHTLTSADTVLAPSIGGDITRSIEVLPGVAAADNSAAFNVRGSVVEDVSLVLDGLELYEPFHLEAFQSPFSLVDSNVVDRVDFFGGGFTADFGDRHGGFVEISTVAPGESAGGEVEIGTVNSRAAFGTTAAGHDASWLLSARGWYPDAVLQVTELGGGENLDPRFADAYAKATFGLSPRTLLFAHGLLVYDRLEFVEEGEEINEQVDARTQGGYAWLRLLTARPSGSSAETMLSGGTIESRRRGVAALEEGPVNVDDDRDLDFFGLKHDSILPLTEVHVLKVGADVRWLRASYRYSNDLPDDPKTVRLDPDGTSIGAYVAHRARVATDLTTELGLRWDRQSYTGDNQLSPRFNAAWHAGERSELRLALGRFNQSQRIHELHVEEDETEFGGAEVAEQAELSFQHGFRPGVRLRVDAYYRELSDLRTRYENLFEPIELFPETAEDRVDISPEKARLRGVEILLSGNPERPFFGWTSYALSAAEDVVKGVDEPRSWDQTHALRFLVGYQAEERWSVSVIGSIHTGWPTTPRQASLETPPGGTPEIVTQDGPRNSDRFPTYGRLDLKLRRAVAVPRGSLRLTLEVINLTDRKNPCCIDEFVYEPQPDDTVLVDPKYDHWLGITPSFSALWEF
jgi:hypothetical protein